MSRRGSRGTAGVARGIEAEFQPHSPLQPDSLGPEPPLPGTLDVRTKKGALDRMNSEHSSVTG